MFGALRPMGHRNDDDGSGGRQMAMPRHAAHSDEIGSHWDITRVQTRGTLVALVTATAAGTIYTLQAFGL